jgi:hypothetical protein
VIIWFLSFRVRLKVRLGITGIAIANNTSQSWDANRGLAMPNATASQRDKLEVVF